MPGQEEGQGQAGEEPGQHVLEVDVSLEELARILGEELELPNIEPRGDRQFIHGRFVLLLAGQGQAQRVMQGRIVGVHGEPVAQHLQGFAVALLPRVAVRQVDARNDTARVTRDGQPVVILRLVRIPGIAGGVLDSPIGSGPERTRPSAVSSFTFHSGGSIRQNASNTPCADRPLKCVKVFNRSAPRLIDPPGTGKSRTVTSIILGAALEAERSGRPLRILLSAFTYTAIDNVLLEVYREAQHLLPQTFAQGIFRLRSYLAAPAPQDLQAVDVALNARNPSSAINDLWDRLWQAAETTIVAATSQQVHNLLVKDDGPARLEMFDLIVIDSAPLLGVTDTKVLSRFVDRLLFVVQWDKTNRETALNSLAHIREARGRVAGIVLTQVDMRRHARYGYGDVGQYYGKYHKYYVN